MANTPESITSKGNQIPLASGDLTATQLPTHASRHNLGGTDAVGIDASQVASGTLSTSRIPNLPGSIITSSFIAQLYGGLGFSLASTSQNAVLAGPATGGAGAVMARALVAADVPLAFGQILNGQFGDSASLLSSSGTTHYIINGMLGSAIPPTNVYSLMASVPSWAQKITYIGVSCTNSLTGTGTMTFKVLDQTASTILSTLTFSSGSGTSALDTTAHTLTTGHNIAFSYAGNAVSGGSIGNVFWEIHLNLN